MSGQAAPVDPGPSFIDDWDASYYLDEFYNDPVAPEQYNSRLRFLARNLARIGRVFESAIEFGCGPVLFHAASFMPWTRRLDMVDLRSDNLGEIDAWLAGDPKAFDWTPFIGGEHGVLAVEGSDGTVAEREALMRERIRSMRGDITTEQPLGRPAQYQLAASFNSLEWVVPTLDGWRTHVGRFTSLLEPGGWVLMAALHNDTGIPIGDLHFRCATVTRERVEELLTDLDFVPESIVLELSEVVEDDETPPHQDIFVCAQKRG